MIHFVGAGPGDPSLFGAVREQLDALARKGIPCEIVPGVSSFSAAAAALKSEYTLPGVYKASWPEERVIHGQLENIAASVREAGIVKTALLAAGNFLGSEYQLSKLYDAGFSHQYRTGRKNQLTVDS
jgi:precorrin-4/cobalt-precorrin-4 C11-methyltransferase